MEISKDFNIFENNINERNILFKMEDPYNNPYNNDLLSTQQNSNFNITPIIKDKDIYTQISKDSIYNLDIPTEKHKNLENKNYFPSNENNNIIEEIGYDIKNININTNTNDNKNSENQKDNLTNKTSNIINIFDRIKPKEKKIFSLFEVIYPPKLPRQKKNKSAHEKKIRNRFADKDNILVKIKTNFFNTHIIKLLKKNLISIGSHKNIEKFPAIIVKDVNKNKKNKELWSMTLAEFLLWINTLNKNYKFKDIVNNVLVQKSDNFREILNKKLCELYKDYIASDEFKKVVINKIELKYSILYVNKFKDIAANLLNHFSVSS